MTFDGLPKIAKADSLKLKEAISENCDRHGIEPSRVLVQAATRGGDRRPPVKGAMLVGKVRPGASMLPHGVWLVPADPETARPAKRRGRPPKDPGQVRRSRGFSLYTVDESRLAEGSKLRSQSESASVREAIAYWAKSGYPVSDQS